MADVDIEAQLGAQVKEAIMGTTAMIYNVFLVVLGLVILGLLIWFIIEYFSYKIKFRVRIVAKNKKIIVDDKAKFVMDKEDGVRYLKLRSRKHLLPLPPSEAIESDNKGAYVIEAYYTDSEEYQYMIDKLQKEKMQIVGIVPALSLNKKNKWVSTGKYIYISDTDESVQSFQPFTTNQRLILINQYKKAYARKTFKWTEHIPMIASIVAVVMIFALMLVFWEDLTKPSLQAMDTSKEIQKQNLQIVSILRDIYLNRQSVDSAAVNATATPTPPG